MGSKISVTYILSHVDKALAFEWIAAGIDPESFNLSFILLNEGPSDIEQYLQTRSISVARIPFSGSKTDFPGALWRTHNALKMFKPDVVHAHLFKASLIGLAAAYCAGVPRRIYTRHHSDYHHAYFPSAVKYDKLINKLATDIIAISLNVRNILTAREHVPPDKVRLIHHGFDMSTFNDVADARISRLKRKYRTDGRFPVIGLISRYTHWKGLQYAIPAFRNLLKVHPNALLLLANARGSYKNEVHDLLAELPSESYLEIPFEPDNAALFRLFDVFVHVPIDPECEAFGQTYVEALASGIPSVFSQSGIAAEFIADEVNAIVVPFEDSEPITRAIQRLLSNDTPAHRLIANGKRAVEEKFGLPRMLRKLECVYRGDSIQDDI